MSNKSKLNGTWLRAAVLGCLWAASEIVLGSFLHNIRMPFTGNVMTGIAIILLVSVGYLWNMKGLFWRAGLICALMKSISPSAVIFSPMIAICCEAFLLELSVRVAGRNVVGFVLGGMLAMLWNLIHFIGSYILMYGMDIIGLYKKIALLAGKQLGMQFENGWLPVLVLAVVYLFFGFLASVLGIYIGVKLKNKPAGMINLSAKKVMQRQQSGKIVHFHFSRVWLFVNLVGLITTLCLMSFCSYLIWIPAGTAMLVIWIIRYRNSLRPLRNPKFWISFVVITLLMGWLYTGIQDGAFLSINGLMAGLEMNFRAVLMIIGFSAIGRELINPVIKKYFSGSGFKQLAGSLEVAFDTLPLVIANLPGPKEILRKPVGTLKQLVSQADTWLEKVSIQFSEKPFVIIVSGSFGSGKSRIVRALTEKLKHENIATGGFTAPPVMVGDKRVGYDLYDVASGISCPLARTTGEASMPFVGRFYFRPESIETGNEILRKAAMQNFKWVIVDEIGPWEMAGQGWARGINHLLMHSSSNMIWVVREGLLQDVLTGWNLTKYKVFRTSECSEEDIITFVLSKGSTTSDNTL